MNIDIQDLSVEELRTLHSLLESQPFTTWKDREERRAKIQEIEKRLTELTK